MKGIFNRFFKKAEEKIHVPNIEAPKKAKNFTIKVVKVKNIEDLSDLRNAASESNIIFIRTPVSLVGSERKTLLSKIKLIGTSTGKRLYGMDLYWYILTDQELQ